jgi:hypothetical protein
MSENDMMPMSEAEIKQFIERHTDGDRAGRWCDICRLILTGIEQTARAEQLAWLVRLKAGRATVNDLGKGARSDSDWIDAVKVRVGWRD